MTTQSQTYPVTDDVFRAVYDSAAALPGRHKRPTREADVRQSRSCSAFRRRPSARRCGAAATASAAPSAPIGLMPNRHCSKYLSK